jgi:hypothetical protein
MQTLRSIMHHPWSFSHGFMLSVAHRPSELCSGTAEISNHPCFFSDWEAFTGIHSAVKMPVPVSSMPQGARGPSTLDKRTELSIASACRPANSLQ